MRPCRLVPGPLMLASAVAALLAFASPLRAQAAAAGSAAPPAGASAPACTVRELSRAPLVVDGSREMYIEPMVALHAGGETFLAGSPNYLYAPGTAAEPRDFVRDSVFGAILGSDGRARLIPAPLDPTRIASVHGAVLPNGRWAFVFAQVKNPWVGAVPDTIVGLWHAIHDGRTWTTLERLPSPNDGTFL